jgi:hypothetical protein
MPDFLALAPQGIALANAAIFLDSLRYKFTDHPKTQEIFGRLDSWAGSFGARGLFSRGGLFGQYVIGAAELAASVLMLTGTFYSPLSVLMPLGAALSFALMSGAIGFHLFTPLGIDPNRDGGGLFRAACLVWLGSLFLVCVEAGEVIAFARSALA